MTTYNEAVRVSKIAENYAHDYRDMAMRQEVLRRLLADFYNECQHLDQEDQEKPCPCGSGVRESVCKDKNPQQPEEIEELDMNVLDDSPHVIKPLMLGVKINAVIRTLNRLTHKD